MKAGGDACYWARKYVHTVDWMCVLLMPGDFLLLLAEKLMSVVSHWRKCRGIRFEYLTVCLTNQNVS